MDEQKMATNLAPPSMLIMGPGPLSVACSRLGLTLHAVERKYIVRPDIGMLLEQMAATDDQRREAAERRLEEEARVKKEQDQEKLLKKMAAGTAAKAGKSATAPKASGSAPRAPAKKKAS
jgi:hypothetical protein